MMPSSFDQAIREMCATAVSQAVAALAGKYGFDQEEALRDLNLGDLKLVRKRGPAPKETGGKKAAKEGSPKDGSSPRPSAPRPATFSTPTTSAPPSRLSSRPSWMEGAKLKPQDTVKGIAARWKAEEPEIRTMWAARAKGEYEPAPVAAVSDHGDFGEAAGPQEGSSYTGD